MKQKKWLAILVMLILACSGIVSTAAAPTNPTEFITCNIDGVATNNKFSKINFTLKDITNTNGYAYVGIDIGVFQKPTDYDTKLLNADWKAVSIERVFSNSLNFEVSDFGDYSKYQQGQVYVLGYRVLYLEASAQQNLIIESPWRRVDDNSNNDYFTFLGNIVFTDRVTGANMWIDTDTKADQYNKYTPGSEVVCKFIISAKKNSIVDRHEISMNLCNENELNIDYVKLLKVDVGSSSIPVSDITVNKKSGSNSTYNFSINSPEDEIVTVYFKYKFSKKDIKKPLTITKFNNILNIKAYSGANVTDYNAQNMINVLDTEVIYR